MEPFQILEVRGHIMLADNATQGGIAVPEDDGTGAARRRTITQGSRSSSHDVKAPFDMMRSRRIGLTRQVCTDCKAIRYNVGDARTEHSLYCTTPGTWRRNVTGPLRNDESAKHTSWHKP